VRGCGRKGFRGDPLAHEWGLRAGALNRGLAPRDSLLIAADSLSEALFDQLGDSVWREQQGRLFATLDATVQRYPGDPEAWYELGDALYHWPIPSRTTVDGMLNAFDRAIALDSTFGPPYVHAIELAFQVGRIDAARRYLDAYLALNQTDPNSEGMGLVAKLLATSQPSPEATRQLQAASSYVLNAAGWVLRGIPDSAESAVQVARALVQSRPSGEPVLTSRRSDGGGSVEPSRTEGTSGRHTPSPRTYRRTTLSTWLSQVRCPGNERTRRLVSGC